jgi:hypothetical protein
VRQLSPLIERLLSLRKKRREERAKCQGLLPAVAREKRRHSSHQLMGSSPERLRVGLVSRKNTSPAE